MARVLIVDDDEVTRLALGTVLEAANHQVGYAASGDVALDTYARRAFDVVIVDLVLPGKSGLLTIRELLKMDKYARVIAISGLAPEDLDLAERYGALRTFVKPMEPAALLQAVVDVMRRRSGWVDLDKTGWR